MPDSTDCAMIDTSQKLAKIIILKGVHKEEHKWPEVLCTPWPDDCRPAGPGASLITATEPVTDS